MSVVILIGCLALVLCVVLDAWAALCSIASTSGTPTVAPPVATEPVGSKRCADEANLVAALLDCRLDAETYHDAMATLAAADAGRHPVVVPPEGWHGWHAGGR